ncbi:MAG: ATP-binding protein [Candidatus Saccharimonadaceae bacterium]|nr:ATP-binding protein [Candidatus Saccharimonadaceae bacterium]
MSTEYSDSEIAPIIDDYENANDFKETQQITGLIAAASIMFVALDVLLFPVSANISQIVWTTLAALGGFTLLYFLIPPIYMIRGLSFLPDLILISGFAIIMTIMGERGGLFILLIIAFSSISAYTKSNWLYIMTIFEAFTALIMFFILNTEYSENLTIASIIFQIIGVFALISILRIFSREIILMRNSQKRLVRAARELENQKNEILTLINSLSDGLISVDIDRKIAIANRAAYSMLGFSQEDEGLVGKVLNDVMSVSSDEARLSLADESLRVGKQMSYDDLKLISPNGVYRVSVNTNPIYSKDKSQIGAIIMFRDVTAEKSLEEQRAEFNSIASHELRTPLAIIEGFTFNLMFDKKLKYDSKTKNYISQIDKAVKSLIKLTNDILTVTKVDNDQIKLDFSNTDMKNLVKGCVDDFKEKADAKHLKLNLLVTDDLPEILTDGSIVKEVLSNMIENAIKYTEKGSVSVEASENEKGIVTVKVVDSGIGINENDLDRIFNRFYRIADFRTQKVGGTGLGLYICRNFITALGGKIGAESKKGKGSTFWFSIPVSINKKTVKEKSEEQLDSFIQSI